MVIPWLNLPLTKLIISLLSAKQLKNTINVPCVYKVKQQENHVGEYLLSHTILLYGLYRAMRRQNIGKPLDACSAVY